MQVCAWKLLPFWYWLATEGTTHQTCLNFSFQVDSFSDSLSSWIMPWNFSVSLKYWVLLVGWHCLWNFKREKFYWYIILCANSWMWALLNFSFLWHSWQTFHPNITSLPEPNKFIQRLVFTYQSWIHLSFGS